MKKAVRNVPIKRPATGSTVAPASNPTPSSATSATYAFGEKYRPSESRAVSGESHERDEPVSDVVSVGPVGSCSASSSRSNPVSESRPVSSLDSLGDVPTDSDDPSPVSISDSESSRSVSSRRSSVAVSRRLSVTSSERSLMAARRAADVMGLSPGLAPRARRGWARATTPTTVENRRRRPLADRIEQQLLFDAFDLVLDVADGVDVRGDRADAFVDEVLDHLGFGAGLPADTRVDVVFAAGLDDVADQAQHGGVEFVEAVSDVLVVPVDRERVLGQIVGPEGGEADPRLGHLLDRQRGGRCLDHGTPAALLGVDAGFFHA